MEVGFASLLYWALERYGGADPKNLRCVVLARGSAALCLQLSEQVSIRRRIGQEDEFAPKTYIVGSPERLA